MANEVLALTKTTRDGRTATVSITRNAVAVYSVARVEGDDVGHHCGPHHVAVLPDGTASKAVGRLILTDAEAAQMEAAWQEYLAALPVDLDKKRRSLVETVQFETESLLDYRADAWDSYGGGTDPFPELAEYEQRLADAERELAEFDAEHPEIKDKVAAAQRAATLRAMEL